MQRDSYAISIRADSDCTEEKYSAEELASILSEAKIKLPRLVARYAKEMGVSTRKFS